MDDSQQPKPGDRNPVQEVLCRRRIRDNAWHRVVLPNIWLFVIGHDIPVRAKSFAMGHTEIAVKCRTKLCFFTASQSTASSLVRNGLVANIISTAATSLGRRLPP
jgi:hypothetical protein